MCTQFAKKKKKKLERYPTYDLLHLTFMHIALIFMYTLTKPVLIVQVAKQFGHVPRKACPASCNATCWELVAHIPCYELTQANEREKKKRTLTSRCTCISKHVLHYCFHGYLLGLGAVPHITNCYIRTEVSPYFMFRKFMTQIPKQENM